METTFNDELINRLKATFTDVAFPHHFDYELLTIEVPVKVIYEVMKYLKNDYIFLIYNKKQFQNYETLKII